LQRTGTDLTTTQGRIQTDQLVCPGASPVR
jgi:hypothetical protein